MKPPSKVFKGPPEKPPAKSPEYVVPSLDLIPYEEGHPLYKPAVLLVDALFKQNLVTDGPAAERILATFFKLFTVPTEPSPTTVPLSSFLSSLKDTVHHTLAIFHVKTFPELRSRLLSNLIFQSGFDEKTYKGQKLKFPQDNEDKEALNYLIQTPLLDFFNSPIPFAIPKKTFASHGVILAPPNHGKTQLLGSFLAAFLQDPDPPGIALLDPHGDLFELMARRVDPSRLVILDPNTDPPPLNFLDFGTSNEAQTLQTFAYLMASLSGGLSEKQSAIVPYLLKLLRQIPNASLETLRQVIDEKIKRIDQSAFHTCIAALPQVDQDFFHNQFYSSRMQETKDAIGWKLYSALSSDTFRQMFSANINSFNADDALRDRKVVLVRGSRQSLGDEGMKVFLQFIVAQYFSAALRRESVPPEQRYLTVLAVDEASHVFNPQTANILTECRKYGLGFLAATQVVQQIPDEVKAAIYGATAIKIAGPVSHSDAMMLAREMYTSGDFLRSMTAHERSHAEWAFYVSGLTHKHALKINVPYGRLEALPTISEDDFHAFLEKKRYVQPVRSKPTPPPPVHDEEALPQEVGPAVKTPALTGWRRPK